VSDWAATPGDGPGREALGAGFDADAPA
jgi:hypothetical protein